MAHLGDTILSSMEDGHIQQIGNFNENAKRGTLSILFHAIKNGVFAKKFLLLERLLNYAILTNLARNQLFL